MTIADVYYLLGSVYYTMGIAIALGVMIFIYKGYRTVETIKMKVNEVKGLKFMPFVIPLIPLLFRFLGFQKRR